MNPVARNLLQELDNEAKSDSMDETVDLTMVVEEVAASTDPATPVTRAINAVPTKYNPTAPDAVPARMIEAIMVKHAGLKYLTVTRVGGGSEVRDPGFAAMKDPHEVLRGIVGVFVTAGYSVAVSNTEAVVAVSRVALATAGQAIYDLFLRHQMQRKIESVLNANRGGLCDEKQLRVIAEQYVGRSKEDVEKIYEDNMFKDPLIVKLEGYLQTMAEKLEKANEAAEKQAKMQVVQPTKVEQPTKAKVEADVKPTVKSDRVDYYTTSGSAVKTELKTKDYLADIYDECMPTSTSVNAAGRLRQSAVAELKNFDGRSRDEFRCQSWLSHVRSAFRRDQLTPGEACLHFPDLLADRAKNWYRQLPRTIRSSWPALQQEFEDEYCGATITPLNRYFNMTRKANEEHIDYLYRLNVQALEAGVKYDSLGDARSHIKHFIATCDDHDLARQLGLNMPTSVHTLRAALQNLHLQEARVRRDESSQKTGRRDVKEDRSTRLGSPQKPINVNAIKLKSPSYVAASDSGSDWSGSDDGMSNDGDSDREGEADQPDGDALIGLKPTDDVTELLAKIFAATRVREAPIKAKQQTHAQQQSKTVTWQKPDPCTHCGSHRHRDRDCWRRLTCETCGRTGHPTEHCYQQCRGCGKVHDRGKCQLEEIVNQLKVWYNPTEHVGILPPTVEKWLN